MKKISSLIAAIFLFFFSCQNFLDGPEPSDQLSLHQVFETVADLEAALTGVYDIIQRGEVMGGNIPALADFFGGNAAGWFEEVSALQMEANHWLPERMWVEGYRAVNQANAILDALPQIVKKDATLTSENAARIEGETLFLRGVLYFELVRLFALPYGHDPENDPGLPILLTPVLKKEKIQFPVRATVKEVYQQAAADLEKARVLLPEKNGKGRAAKFAATGYLAKMAFQQEDYPLAANLSKEILERTDLFSLTETPQDFFVNEGSKEEIWVVFGSEANDPIVGGLSTVYGSAPVTGSITGGLRDAGFMAVLSAEQKFELQNAGYQLVDLRCDPGDIFSNGNLLVLEIDTSRCNKYESGLGEDDVPFARLPEFMLMRAEALTVINGLNQESTDLLNQIRRRSLRVIDMDGKEVPGGQTFFEYEPGDFQNKEELIEAIILERRVELAFEGNYLHDLMRLKRDVLNNGKTFSYYHDKLRLPIPQREIDANPKLTQNPGY